MNDNILIIILCKRIIAGNSIPNESYTFHSYIDPERETKEDREYLISYRKRIVLFVQKWVVAVRNAVFEDPIAVEFIEVSADNIT